MPHATADGPPVYYEDSDGPGPAVLFCHGFLMDRTMFEPQVESLAPEFRCLVMDERGFGRTPVSGPFDYWDLAADAMAVLEDAGVASAALVGMSQGGYLALRAALRNPERVAALALIDTQAAADGPEAVAGYREMFDAWTAAGPTEDLLETLADMILGRAPELRGRWIRKWREKSPVELVHPVECLLSRDDVTDRLPEIRCPALVIHGTEDVAIPLARAVELDRQLPGSEGLIRVEGAAHAPNLTHPGVVNPPLRDFLRRHLG